MKSEKGIKQKEEKQSEKYEISATEFSELSPIERDEWMPIKAKYEKIPIWCYISLSITAISVLLYIAFCLSKQFADFFNIHVSSIFRFLLAQLTNLIPFSIAEAAILSIPFIIFIVIWYLWKFRCNTRKSTLVSLVCIFSVASLFLSSFILTFSAGYRGTTLDQKLEIDADAVSAQDLYHSADYLADRINELSENITYKSNGFSEMPYSFEEMNKRLIEAYDKYSKDHYFINNYYSRLKPVLISEVMSYAHITGVYTFFTGESNLNIKFPDYSIPYTAAHELAHQRGIAREDEANMIAFLVSMESDDEYIRYSAYVNVFEYIMNALYRADKNLYMKVYRKLDKSVISEQVAYGKFFKKYEKSVTSQVSGTINDAYLQSQGTPGRKSYGMVVDLTVAYLKNEQLIPKQ